MAKSRAIRPLGVPLRTVVHLLWWSGVALGQENGDATFDLRDDAPTPTWQDLVIWLTLGLAVFGLWRLLTWWVERRREASRWRKLRLWWPTIMLVFAWLLLALPAESGRWTWGRDAFLIAFSLVNLPGMIIDSLVLGLLDPATVWLRILIGSFAIWSGNYFVIRLAEWRARERIPIALRLLDEAQDGDRHLR